MRFHGVVHYQDGRLDVHDVVLVSVEKQPVVEQGELGIAHRHLAGTQKKIQLEK